MKLPGDTKGWREGWSEMGDGESGHKGGVSIVLAKCGMGGSIPQMSARCQRLRIRFFFFPASLNPAAY